MSLDALAPRPPSALRILSIGALLGLFAALAWRLHAFVDANAVNILYWDQWDFYQPIFREAGLWDIFTHQHGPHRQGLGFVLTRVLAELSAWNVRWDAFAISFLMMGAGVLALRLALRCGMRLGLGLAAIPLFFLNIRQYEALVGPANISHGAMPIALFMLYCLVWFWEGHVRRLLALSVLNFFLIFTGFGLFVGLLTPPLLLLEGVGALRTKQIERARWVGAALLASLLAWAVFAHGYTFSPAVEGFRFPYEKPMEYLYFVALMFSNFFGLLGRGSTTLICGLLLSLAVTAIFFLHGWRLLRQGLDGNRVSVVLFCLSGYALLYTANTAVGRVFLGLESAVASRYVPLMVPAMLALLLQIGQLINTRLSVTLACLFAVLTSAGTLRLDKDEHKAVEWYRKGRETWKAVYLRTHNQDEADRIAKFKIFPAPLDERIHYVEKHRLNLFSPEKP